MRPSKSNQLQYYSTITCQRRPALATYTCHRRSWVAQCVGSSRNVIVLDATNILAKASADRQRWQHVPGQSLLGAFQAWLAFLRLLAADALLVAVFDEPKAQRQGKGQRASSSPDYLARRQRRKGDTSTAGATSSAHTSSLHPALTRVRQAGGVPIVASGGWEADDFIAAVCRLANEFAPAASVAIASGDSDMQSLLSPSVSWLHLLPLATAACPLGVQLVTAADFERQYQFLPAAYSDYLAFTGKPDASIGGMEVGAAAARLLKRYGSINGTTAAAARGELSGWSPAVQQLFSNPGKLQALQRNQELFSLRADPALLGGEQRSELEAALRQRTAAAAGSPAGPQGPHWQLGAAGLAWQHPLHAGRWSSSGRHVQSLAAQLALAGREHAVQALTPGGLPVDILAPSRGHHAQHGSSSGSIGSGATAIIVCGLGDFRASAVPAAQQACPAGESALPATPDAAGRRNKALAPHLNSAVRHHLGMLKKAGLLVVCVPWWLLEPGPAR